MYSYNHHRFLQANINHCSGSQDLLLQSMRQWSIDVAVVSEPYFVPPNQATWLGDLDGSVVVIASGKQGVAPPSLIAKGKGYVACKWGGYLVIGVYLPPSRSLAEVDTVLSLVGALVGQTLPTPVLIAGDFNAKSTAWGSPSTDVRGEAVEEWATTAGLTIANVGSVDTCVRHNGGSIVDLTFTTPNVAQAVRDWKVLDDVETLSDHLYIRFDVSTSQHDRDTPRPRREGPSSPRWVLKKLDREALELAAITQAWVTPPEVVEVESEVQWFGEASSQICDACMPRAKTLPPKQTLYWWTPEIAELRSQCVQRRRRYSRCRRRVRRDPEEEGQLYDAYRASALSLQVAIREAKERHRAEQLATLDRDPWGRPYKAVRNKLRPWAPPLTECLEPALLERVVSSLFPHRGVFDPPAMAPTQVVEEHPVAEVPEVTLPELGVAVNRLRVKGVIAPGPDGVPGRILVVALRELGERFMRLMDACFRTGLYPARWKTGRLVLIRKEGRPAESPSAYRPIVLLDEMGKLFERVIAARIIHHLEGNGRDLSDYQFGFRPRRSTVDAILRVKDLAKTEVERGGVLMAVSLDIANAFNTLPWEVIREALKWFNVPPYLYSIVGSYLSDRYIEYPGPDGCLQRRAMSCGVPQGSVLGPLLWNIGYDWVLRGALLPGASVTCYADDTLVAARGATYRDAALLATASVAQVVQRIKMLGLEVALSKSEALCFHGPRRAPPAGSHIVVSGTRIEVRTEMRYLGLILDPRWSFRQHFVRLIPRLLATAAALRRLMPNLGGPKSSSRLLYSGVVRSMALYGAPVWEDALTTRNIALLRRPQRAMAVGAIRGYRTISFEAACVLAGTPPWALEAGVLASLYQWRENLRDRGTEPTHTEVERRRLQLRQSMLLEWEQTLANPSAGIRTVEAVHPVLKDWMEREWGSLTYRLTQVLTGHGCFGRYLCHTAIREPTTECHHCSCDNDTAQHTLEECPAWARERGVLVTVVGTDLSLPTVVQCMVGSREAWAAVRSFCEEVISQKEALERERECDPSSLPMRHRRTGARRRRYNQLLPP